MTAWLVTLCVLVAADGGEATSSSRIAEIVDRRISEKLSTEGVVAAPAAEDAEFLRRVTLDLIGRTPTPEEIRSFLADSSATKRAAAIDRLLADSAHADHFAKVWRALLIPEADTDRQIRFFQSGFEAWLRQSRQERVGFDQIVRELFTVPIASADKPAQFVMTDMKAPNPIAFIASKEADPAKLAANATRLFLGIRMECAQCHDHPFDHWTRDQFWNQAAFFAGVKRQGRGGAFARLTESVDQRSISVMETGKTVPAMFLDGHSPDDGKLPRATFAEWMTARENPFFAKATVNRIWAQLMGVGIVDPVDDFQATNPASHPELLDELAAEFTRSGYDLDSLYHGICRSAAYQRTSRQTDPTQTDARRFAKGNLKSMSGEQFYSSLMVAMGEPTDDGRLESDRDQNALRRRLLDLFTAHGGTGEPQTSVPQALTLMNGRLVADAVKVETSLRLKKLLEDSTIDDCQRISELYLASVGRLPLEEETNRLVAYLADGGDGEREGRLGDVLWSLINSAEFQWNY